MKATKKKATGNDCPEKAPEEDRRKQELTSSLAATKEIIGDVAAVAVLSELDCIFT